MKRNYFIFLFLLCFFISCKSKDQQASGKSENNIDAARNFIRAALDDKFDEARTFMLPDSANNNYMDVVERSFNNNPQSVKDSLRTATIIIHNVQDVIPDSITIITFSNSYKKKQDDLKVVKINNQYLIDLKYLFEHGKDSIPTRTIINDSLK